jgi:RNA polymerase sigma-70 factor (ECF subfamily)
VLTRPNWVEDVELAQSVSIAMLMVLETLGPTERAVFVLREVFETPYDEIANALEKSPAAVRQIAHRAREHVAARRPRMVATQAEHQAAVDRFRGAIQDGDLQGLIDVLAHDVVVVADGGGQVPALRRPVEGADRVARLFAGFSTRVAPGARIGAVWLNGAPAIRIDLDGELRVAICLVIEATRVTRIYAIANPDKLARLGRAMQLSLPPPLGRAKG